MHEMSADKWHQFFLTCAELLGPGDKHGSWCAVTTFQRLSDDAGYWTHGLPRASDLAPTHVNDGGVWGQPFAYADIAHVIIPKTFGLDRSENGEWQEYVSQTQEIELLSKALAGKGIDHRLTSLVLEIKLF
ncbi:MAG TPA: hypothetical protein VFH89_16000 [Sphingomicrobium sp.]|nr:hypothetical protein [Sphingomicrobium sp.]